MLQKILQPPERPKEELLHDLFLFYKNIVLTYPMILSVLSIDNLQQLRKLVYKLRLEKFLYIQTVQKKGYIYKGSQLE